MKKALVFGGNGFLGAYVVRELCKQNFQVVIVSRNEGNFETLKVYGFPGQIVWKKYDVMSITFAHDFNFKDYNVIINLIGIAEQSGKNSYYKIHSEIPSIIAQNTRKAGVSFIHVSALVPKIISSKYAKTKQEGELSVLRNNPKAIVIKPSLMIGEGGSFVNDFETIINLSPIVPLIMGGKKKIRPIYVGDVAKFIALAIEKPEMQGKAFKLCGTETILMKDFIMKIAGFMNKRRFYISTPLIIFKIFFTVKSFLPKFIFRTKLSKDILELSKYEVLPETNDLTLLVKNPVKIDEVLNLILEKYKLYQ